MITEKTLSLLLAKIPEIQALCKKHGLENLRIIKPESIDDWDKITILGEEKNKILITSDLDFLKDATKALLDCDVSIVTESMLREHVKKRVLGEAVLYTEDSKSSLTKLFNEELLLLAKRNQQSSQKRDDRKHPSLRFSLESPVVQGQNVPKRPRLGDDPLLLEQRVMDLLKSDKELWEKLHQSPEKWSRVSDSINNELMSGNSVTLKT